MVVVMMVVVVIAPVDIGSRHNTVIAVVMMVMMVVVVIKILGKLHRLLSGGFRGQPRVVGFQSLGRIRNGLQQVAIARDSRIRACCRWRGLGCMHRGQRRRGTEETGNFLVHRMFPCL